MALYVDFLPFYSNQHPRPKFDQISDRHSFDEIQSEMQILPFSTRTIYLFSKTANANDQQHNKPRQPAANRHKKCSWLSHAMLPAMVPASSQQTQLSGLKFPIEEEPHPLTLVRPMCAVRSLFAASNSSPPA